jgi:hypothetical protein
MDLAAAVLFEPDASELHTRGWCGDMPRWMLRCPNCSHKFPHSAIDAKMVEQAFRDPFRVLPRPEFSAEGERRACPSCKKESVFRPFQLFYSDDSGRSEQV